MRVRLLKVAQQELDDGVDYYNNEQPGLGYRFLAEVLETIDRIKEFPEAWQPFHRRTHRCQVHHFPYGVIYQRYQDLILVVAIAHLHRRSDYWLDRLS